MGDKARGHSLSSYRTDGVPLYDQYYDLDHIYRDSRSI